MGLLSDKLCAEYEGSSIEVRADNHVLKGLIYKLFVDGEEASEARNFLKIPAERTLEADVAIGGKTRRVIVEVKQKMVSTEFALSVDGVSVPLQRVG